MVEEFTTPESKWATSGWKGAYRRKPRRDDNGHVIAPCVFIAEKAKRPPPSSSFSHEFLHDHLWLIGFIILTGIICLVTWCFQEKKRKGDAHDENVKDPVSSKKKWNENYSHDPTCPFYDSDIGYFGDDEEIWPTDDHALSESDLGCFGDNVQFSR